MPCSSPRGSILRPNACLPTVDFVPVSSTNEPWLHDITIGANGRPSEDRCGRNFAPPNFPFRTCVDRTRNGFQLERFWWARQREEMRQRTYSFWHHSELAGTKRERGIRAVPLWNRSVSPGPSYPTCRFISFPSSSGKPTEEHNAKISRAATRNASQCSAVQCMPCWMGVCVPKVVVGFGGGGKEKKEGDLKSMSKREIITYKQKKGKGVEKQKTSNMKYIAENMQ